MRIEHRAVDGVLIIEVLTEVLDANNASAFCAAVDGHLAGGPPVVFDLGAIVFADSSGLGAIVACLRKLNDLGGDLLICGIRPRVQKLFATARLDRIIGCHDTVEAAVAAYASARG